MKEFIKNSDVFFRFIDSIVEERDRSDTLNGRVGDIRDYLGADRCTLFLYDKQAKRLVSRAGHGTGHEQKVAVNKRSLVGYCFLSGNTVRVRDVYDEEELRAIDKAIRFSRKRDEASGYRTKNALVTAITVRGRKVGVLQALNKPGGFIGYSVEGVVEFAPMLGLAVEIVMLDDALKRGVSFEELPFS